MVITPLDRSDSKLLLFSSITLGQLSDSEKSAPAGAMLGS